MRGSARLACGASGVEYVLPQTSFHLSVARLALLMACASCHDFVNIRPTVNAARSKYAIKTGISHVRIKV